jgi:riboflavin synthase
MFTGIVEETGTITSIKKNGDGLDFIIEAKKVIRKLDTDNSISVNGVCLTVVEKTKTNFRIQAVHETLLKTNLGLQKKNSKVNLERSVRLNDRLGGHLVQGHIDCVGKVKKIVKLESSWLYTISYQKKYAKYLIPVGSICVDGTSLTTARLSNESFTVAIIPYTYENTIFQDYSEGTIVNLEFDVIGKYIESLLKKK